MRESRNERVPVALPAEQVAAVRRVVDAGVVDAGAADAGAAYVAEAVRGRLARDRALATLNDLYARRGVTLRPDHSWARRALGVDPGPELGGGPGAATA